LLQTMRLVRSRDALYDLRVVLTLDAAVAGGCPTAASPASAAATGRSFLTTLLTSMPLGAPAAAAYSDVQLDAIRLGFLSVC
jgi:hypothetical protein